MEHLITQFIPHAPRMGLYVTPAIPPKKLQNAIGDYAPEVLPELVLALYDNTWLGNGKDGILFTSKYMVFQNTDFDAPQQVWYRDMINAVKEEKRWGKAVLYLDVNRGQAIFTERVDFGAKPKALEYVHRFVVEAMNEIYAKELVQVESDWPVVHVALQRLRDEGHLAQRDFDRLMEHAG